MSERKSEDKGVVDDVENREKGFRDRVRVGMGGRKRPRSRFERMILSKRVMEAKLGVIATEAEVDIGAGAVRSRSEMNSLKAMLGISLAVLESRNVNSYPASAEVQRCNQHFHGAGFLRTHSC